MVMIYLKLFLFPTYLRGEHMCIFTYKQFIYSCLIYKYRSSAEVLLPRKVRKLW